MLDAKIPAIGHRVVRSPRMMAINSLFVNTLLRRRRTVPVTRLGSAYGGWWVPLERLGEHSVCYLAGVGEDASFDIALANQLHGEVWSFDPTPRAVEYVDSLGHIGFKFLPVGLWDTDASVKFFAPRNSAHVSHSALNIQGTSSHIEVECLTVSSIMVKLEHNHIDLLKLDIEGAESRVMDRMFGDGVFPTVLCVEFDEPEWPTRTLRKMRAIKDRGYELIHYEGRNYTFLRDINC